MVNERGPSRLEGKHSNRSVCSQVPLNGAAEMSASETAP